MAKRSKWSIQKTKSVPTPIRDSEFALILADLGKLMYDEISSLPDSVKNIDAISSQTNCLDNASENRKRVFANETK